MELRLFQEELEEKMLGQYAAKSVNTKGRQKEEDEGGCSNLSSSSRRSKLLLSKHNKFLRSY